MQIVITALSTVFAVVPMVFFLSLVWLSDRYAREPLWLVVLTFLWGAIGAVFFALPFSMMFDVVVNNLVVPVLTGWVDASFIQTVAGPAIGAPLVEEPAKALFLLFIAWNRRPTTMSSGFIYGAAAGLGFAMTENFLYFSSQTGGVAQFAWLVLIRTLYCACLHAMATSVTGAAFGFGRLRGWPVWVTVSTLGLFAAMVLHAIWNGLITLDSFSASNLRLANFLLLPLEALFVLFIWQLCLFDDSLAIRRELQAEEDAGHLQPDQSWKLASWWRRRFQTLAPPGVDGAQYVQTATALARRKRELALLGSRAPDFYRDDVHRLRTQLVRLQEPTST